MIRPERLERYFDTSQPLCRYCDHLPDCAYVCDRCQDDAYAEQAAQRPDDYDEFHAYGPDGEL